MKNGIKILVSIIVYFVFVWYLILSLFNCSWILGHWLNECYIDSWNNWFAETVFSLLVVSSFLLWMSIFAYIVWVELLRKKLLVRPWIVFVKKS